MIYTKVAVILLIALTTTSTCFGYVSNILHPASSALMKLGNYDSTVRPPGDSPQGNGAVNVTINLFVINIDKVDHKNNEFTLQMYFREEWKDSRLAFTGSEQVLSNEVQTFWRPDVFFINERSGHVHTITKPNTLVRLQPNGHVLHSTRMSLNLHCPMDLWKFPFDTQICKIQMESYAYTTKDMTIFWKAENPLQINDELIIPGFTLKVTETRQSVTEVKAGEYKVLQAFFQFKRNYSTYIMRVYIPMFLLVVASWSSFWLPSSHIIARIAVGSITSLTTIVLISREEDLLHLPVLTSFDIWAGVSGFYVFAAFFEYILVIYQDSKNDQKGGIKNCEAGKSGKLFGIKMHSDENCTDFLSKIVFSISYLLFNLIFVCLLF